MATTASLGRARAADPPERLARERYTLTIEVAPARVARALGAVVMALTAAHAFCQFILRPYLGLDNVLGLVPFVNLGLENNLPTWYSSAVLLFCAGILAVIGHRARALRMPHARTWAALAAVFVFLSLDETASIHERMSAPVKAHLGSVYNAWVIPASVMVLVGGLLAYRFVMDLPRRTRHLVILAGVLFVGGAMGLEAVAGAIRTIYPYNAEYELTLRLIATLEELLEMVGVVVFAYALLDYLGSLPEPQTRPPAHPARIRP